MLRPALVLMAVLASVGTVIYWTVQLGARSEEARSESLSAVSPVPSGEPASPGVGGRDEDLRRELGEIRERLQHIEQLLEGQASTPRHPATESSRKSTEPAAEPDLQALLVEVKALREELQRSREAVPRSLVELEAEHPEPLWDALEPLMDLWRRDEDAALESVRLRTLEEIIQTYGSPSEVWGSDRGTNWIYGRDKDATGSYLTEVWLLFQDGRVSMLGVK